LPRTAWPLDSVSTASVRRLSKRNSEPVGSRDILHDIGRMEFAHCPPLHAPAHDSAPCDDDHLVAPTFVHRYHDGTKHGFTNCARSLGYLDWASQPRPFREYADAERFPLYP